MVLVKTLESPLESKEIKLVSPKGNQLWIVVGRTDAEAEASILQLPGANSQLIGKVPDAGKDWRQKEKGVAEDEMIRQHTNAVHMRLSKFGEMVKDSGAWRAIVRSVAESGTT